MASDPIRALLVAGHPVIGGVLRLSCEASGIRVAGETGDPRAVVASATQLAPAVVVLDLELPDADGLDCIRDLRAAGYEGVVLAVSERTDGATVLEALRRGAGGYLTKPEGLRRVGTVIRRLVAGERVLDPVVEKVAVAELGRFARQAREGSEIAASLSPREREIIGLLAEGLTMRQIGRRLGISPRTAETHATKLYRKLSVRTRMQAIAKAAQLGLIDLR